MKSNLIVVTTGHMLVNASIQDMGLHPIVERRPCPLVDVVLSKNEKYIDGSFFFSSIYSVLFLNFMLVS